MALPAVTLVLQGADFFTALYFKVLKHNPYIKMGATEENVFLLQRPFSPVFYASLARSGYFDIKELATFEKGLDAG